MTSVFAVIRLIVLILITLGETAFLFYLAWLYKLDLHYFTHVNKLIFVICFWLILLSNFIYTVFQWTIAILLPFLTASGLFVTIGVIILVLYQPKLIIDDLEHNGVVITHTADWLLHHLPLLEVIIITWCLYKHAVMAIRDTIDSKIEEPAARVLFIIFACTLNLIVLAIYILCNDFTDFYLLTELPDATLPTALLVVTAVIASILVFLMFFYKEHKPNPKVAGKTLMVKNRAEQRRICTRLVQEDRLRVLDGKKPLYNI